MKTNSPSGRGFAVGISITPGRLKLPGTKVNFSSAFAALGDISEKKAETKINENMVKLNLLLFFLDIINCSHEFLVTGNLLK